MSSLEQTVGIFTTDANLVIRSWDAWLATYSGISPEQARGELLFALFPELEERGFVSRFERVLQEGIIEVLAPRFHHFLIPCKPVVPSKRYEKMQQYVTIAPLREDKAIVGIIITIEDVTARLDREHDIDEQLASSDEATRLRATQILAEEESRSAAEKLMRSIADESWRVRKTAVDGLVRKANENEVNLLLRALRDEHRNPGVLNSALQVLALSGIDAIEPLAEFLKDTDVDLRIYATHALGDQHDPRAIPVLIDALSDESANVRYHAIEALGKLRASDAVDTLIGIAESKDFFLAFPALDSLRLIGDSRIAPRLVPLLEDDMLRSPTVDVLGQLGTEDVIDPLVSLLNSSKAPTQVIATAIAIVYERFEKSHQSGAYIAELTCEAISRAGVQNLLDAIDQARGETLRSLALILGWLEGDAVERAMVRLLGQPTARKEVIEALVRYGERVTQLLVEQLHAEETETCKAAVIALGRIGDADAVPALVQVLNNNDELAIIAAGALGKIGDRRAFDELLKFIGHKNASVRLAVIAAINSLGHPEMPGLAMKLLRDSNPLIRESAVKIAGYFGYPECTELLLERCRDEDENVRRAAIEHIPYFEDDRVLPILVDAIEHGSSLVRAAAANAFAQVERDSALPHLLKALNDADSWVRYFAVRAIGRHKYAESVGALTRLANTDAASHVRIAAIDTLGMFNEAGVIPVLLSFIDNPDIDLARAALKSLGQIKHSDALPPLLKALRSPDVARRLEAVRSLGLRDEAEVVTALRRTAEEDSDAAVSQTAIEALANLATPEAITSLIELVANPSCQENSIQALSQVDEKNLELLSKGMSHPQANVRYALVQVFERMKHPRASEHLITALDDEDAAIRLTAINALVQLGNRSVDRKLLSMMQTDSDASVRRAAHKALSGNK